MISGIAIASHALSPRTRIVGAQPIGVNSTELSLIMEESTSLPGPPDTEIDDGIKVGAPGARPFAVINELKDSCSVVTVPDSETIAAVTDLLLWRKVVAEGAGAFSVAALRSIQEGRASSVGPFPAESNVVVIISGANIDPSFTWRILYERSVPNLVTLRIPIPDRPGGLLRLLEPVHRLGINIIDVDVNRHDARPRMGERVVELCIAVKSPEEETALMEALAERNYAPQPSRWMDPSV